MGGTSHQSDTIIFDISCCKANMQLENHPIDQVRKLKVVVIGAGLLGLLAGILLPAKVPGIELKILEKNPAVVSVQAYMI